MRRMKKVAAATLTAMMVASLAMGTTETWARSSKRAAWNNAAAESADTETEVRDACYVEDDSQTDAHNVKSNVYANSADVPKVFGGLGTAIISTNHGVITDKEARKLGVGGEVLCYVW